MTPEKTSFFTGWIRKQVAHKPRFSVFPHNPSSAPAYRKGKKQNNTTNKTENGDGAFWHVEQITPRASVRHRGSAMFSLSHRLPCPLGSNNLLVLCGRNCSPKSWLLATWTLLAVVSAPRSARWPSMVSGSGKMPLPRMLKKRSWSLPASCVRLQL